MKLVLSLALDQELGRDALVDHPGQPGQLLDVRDEPPVVLVGGLGKGIHGRDGTPERAPEDAPRPSEPGEPDPEEVTEHALAGRARDRDARSRLGRRDGIARGWHEANPVLADPDLALAGNRRPARAGPRRRRPTRTRPPSPPGRVRRSRCPPGERCLRTGGRTRRGRVAPPRPTRAPVSSCSMRNGGSAGPSERRKRALPRHDAPSGRSARAGDRVRDRGAGRAQGHRPRAAHRRSPGRT